MIDFGLERELLTEQQRIFYDLARQRDQLFQDDPLSLYPTLLRPCRVRILMVADGLDFSLRDFGLRTFVETLTSTPPGPYVKFDITLAHLDNVSNNAVMAGHPGIVRSIKNFKFDDTDNFTQDMYDQVWLFGIETDFHKIPTRLNDGYPRFRLSDEELKALSQFMDNGGGLFATGDHGSLGFCLGGSVPRARSMRIWADEVEVSMTGPRRNDTNSSGHDTDTDFNDQSDDIPQRISPKMYQKHFGIVRFSFPHPLLCGPRGVIRVMPDHPHEGECVEPANTTQSFTFDGYTITEYPAGIGPKPLPEIISTSYVPAGNTATRPSLNKFPTEPHTFGGICAYDGHRASVGRVVTDATWHHFVNVNLIGEIGAPAPKDKGFLATAQGMQHLEDIQAYYRNLAVWLSRPAQIRCMRSRAIWDITFRHRVFEAVATRLHVGLQEAQFGFLYDVGRHARDVLNRYAGRCQSYRFVLDLMVPNLQTEFIRVLDPWVRIDGEPPIPEDIPWFDPEPLFELTLATAITAIREKYPNPTPETCEQAETEIEEVIASAIDSMFGQFVESAQSSAKRFTRFF